MSQTFAWRALNNYQSPPGQYWGHCEGGNYRMFVNLYSQTGTVLEANDPYVDSKVDCTTPVTYEGRLQGQPAADYFLPHSMIVNRHGKRFVNEGDYIEAVVVLGHQPSQFVHTGNAARAPGVQEHQQ